MNAIRMLMEQHGEVDELFKQFDAAASVEARRRIFNEIADALAVHATIEERHFYPAVKTRQTEEILLESVQEHLEIKRVIADLLQMDAEDDSFEGKMKALQQGIQHHVEEEEGELFPRVERMLGPDVLDDLGAAMDDTQKELKREGNPRHAIPCEIDAAASI